MSSHKETLKEYLAKEEFWHIKVIKYRGLLKVKANWHTCIMEKYGQYDWQTYWTGLMWVGWQYQGVDCSSERLFNVAVFKEIC